MKTKDKTVYVSNDGIEWPTLKLCEGHEQALVNGDILYTKFFVSAERGGIYDKNKLGALGPMLDSLVSSGNEIEVFLDVVINRKSKRVVCTAIKGKPVSVPFNLYNF